MPWQVCRLRIAANCSSSWGSCWVVALVSSTLASGPLSVPIGSTATSHPAPKCLSASRRLYRTAPQLMSRLAVVGIDHRQPSSAIGVDLDGVPRRRTATAGCCGYSARVPRSAARTGKSASLRPGSRLIDQPHLKPIRHQALPLIDTSMPTAARFRGCLAGDLFTRAIRPTRDVPIAPRLKAATR